MRRCFHTPQRATAKLTSSAFRNARHRVPLNAAAETDETPLPHCCPSALRRALSRAQRRREAFEAPRAAPKEYLPRFEANREELSAAMLALLREEQLCDSKLRDVCAPRAENGAQRFLLHTRSE
tara:strand:- start:916 stop:1287 length:372 start_codon:yes stop_codon:yes gene_type:complete